MCPSTSSEEDFKWNSGVDSIVESNSITREGNLKEEGSVETRCNDKAPAK